MVDYIYKDLYNKPHIDKQVEIIACDFICYGNPQNIYEGKDEYDRKIFLDALSGIYYMLVKNVNSYKWDVIEKNDGKLIAFRNKDIDWENFELSESLCSESELRFGCCEASVLKFRIHNTFVSLKDKWLTVTETLEGHTDEPFQFGRYKVFSDVPTADRLYRDITAYDSMYDIINSSVIDWYNSILPSENSWVTMKYFRTSFIEYFGLKQQDIALVNDDVILEKTIQVGEGTEIDNETEQTSILKESSLSGLDVMRAICEINGCFGHIGRDGKFHYIYLPQDIMGLYPSNTLFPDHAPDYLPQEETGHLYPQSPKSTRIGNGTYISADYEDFLCKKINKIQIREKENDIGAQYPEENVENENSYIIENNFLVYGKTANALKIIAKNILDKVKDIVYRPFSAECVGNPCLEVGDAIRISTRYELIESYILKRTLKGIQDLRDSYSAEGAEMYSEKVNSISNSIIQLKGKTNTLERNVEETVSKIENVESGVSSRITQLVDSITMSVTNGDKEASVTLHIKDGNTEYDVVSDNINFKGLVSFENLENGGETVINGGNITTGEISCDLLNGGEINGQKIVGGEINGATVTAKEGIKLQYLDTFSKPNVLKEYLFAKTGEGLTSNIPYLNIYSPQENPCIMIGTQIISENPEKFKTKDTPYFPRGAMIDGAYINTLQTTYYEKNEMNETVETEEGVVEGLNKLTFRVRKSGAFVSFYGNYQPIIHERKKGRVFKLENIADYLPTHHSCKTIGYDDGRLFYFTLYSNERRELRIVNLGDDLDASKTLEVQFRLDYFIFP